LQLGQVVLRQRAEKDLQRTKIAAESANRAKTEFLTTMSHEMRTPMNAILGMADLLSESDLREEQRGYVRIFQKAGGSLLELINNLLDLSKVESGHLELESIGFDLPALLEKVMEMMRPQARDRGLKLHLRIMPRVPPGLVGDPNRLRQILINLVGNALKFTERGSVTVTVEPDAGPRHKGLTGWFRFNVIDTGIGIAKGKTDVIFDSFTQADSSTTRKYGGTGLGLSISKGMVELMGGRIGCVSDAGTGSTFFITVPFGIRRDPEDVKSVPAADAAPPVKAALSQPVIRVLIVEDAEYNVLLLKAYLKDPRFVLEIAGNGEIAVQKVMAGDFDVVLMDIQMPVMDGLTATRTIREWEAKSLSKRTPILALTAHANGDGAARSFDAGCDGHLTKPIKKAPLLEAILYHAGGTIQITPPKDIEGLVSGYLANVRRDIAEVLADVGSADYATAQRVGHQFKGSGEGYGFPEITRAGAAVELAARTSNEAEIRRQIGSLASYLDRVEVVV
jgi:CheY-like chemotaxis protein